MTSTRRVRAACTSRNSSAWPSGTVRGTPVRSSLYDGCIETTAVEHKTHGHGSVTSRLSKVRRELFRELARNPTVRRCLLAPRHGKSCVRGDYSDRLPVKLRLKPSSDRGDPGG